MAVDLEFIGSFISLHRKTGFLAAVVSSLTRASNRFFKREYNKTHSGNIWALLTKKKKGGKKSPVYMLMCDLSYYLKL